MTPVNLREKLSLFQDHWNPRVVAELNGQQVRLAKFQGEFVWHAHEHEDELFLVLDGSFQMHFRDRVVDVQQGEFLVVPKGVEHRPVAAREVSVLLFEPADILHTGNVESRFTRRELERI
jgi:mannose-6-phosphate isomerase-like protein (cupin superfamily)